jgi:hypothetical protein
VPVGSWPRSPPSQRRQVELESAAVDGPELRQLLRVCLSQDGFRGLDVGKREPQEANRRLSRGGIVQR